MEVGGANLEDVIRRERESFESDAAAVGLAEEEIRVVARRQDAATFVSRLTREGVDAVRATVTPGSFRDALEKSGGAVFRLARERRPRLRDATARGLVAPGSEDAQRLFDLLNVNDHAYGNVVAVAARFGAETAREVVRNPLLQEADLNTPDGELVTELIGVSPAALLPSEFKKLKGLERPAEWLRSRRDRLASLEDALRGAADESVYRRVCLNADERLIDMVVGEEWSETVKVAALEENAFLNPSRHDQVGHLSMLRERFLFWETDVPRGVLEAKRSPETSRLLSRRVSYLRAMKDMLSPDQYETALTDRDTARHFAQYGDAVSPMYRLKRDTYAGFASRDALPIDADPGAEDRVEEVRDVLAAMGFEPVMRAVALRLQVVEPNRGWKASGGYDNTSGEIRVGANGPYRKQIPAILLHETGHGVQHLLEWDQEGESLMARYGVAAALEPQLHSNYAESYKLRKDGSTHTFVGESFAEDFRLYFLMPERLPERKRRVIDRIVRERFAQVDPDGVRARIRGVLGNFYGARVDEAVAPTDCEGTKGYARQADRIGAESAREASLAKAGGPRE